MVLRMETLSSKLTTAKKRKSEAKPAPDSDNAKHSTESPQPKKSKNKPVKSAPPILQQGTTVKPCLDPVVNTDNRKDSLDISDDAGKKYPLLDNKELVEKFLSVPMTNNQKGRIRQLLRDSLKGTSVFLLPDVIHARIQSIMKNSEILSENELRKIRLLYNMLKTAVAQEKSTADGVKKKIKKTTSKKSETGSPHKADIATVKKDEKPSKISKAGHGDGNKQSKTMNAKNVKSEPTPQAKPKGPKRYVVFVGNLPPDINKERILQHFSEFNECITNIRIPKREEGKKSSIAYVELKNEPTYELALSKHHSMLGSKRINVLYTTQKNSKVSKTEAKSKSAKLIALQKAGKLIGSVPVNRKRSHRRMKMKRAQAKLAAESA